jgi:exopolyphosphatase / guanosine-5'-triphosphate,3'-diphosphate pyrophosphatase
MSTDSTVSTKSPNTSEEPRLAAVIDIGSTSIRMQIAEIRRNGEIRKLESFSQAINVGRDAFSRGFISARTTEDCVQVLSIYRAKLKEYGIARPDQIRVVATSGVRSAANRMAFVDRIFIATEFEIEPFEEAELHRVIYFAITNYLTSEPQYFEKETLFNEVGGGTLELLLLDEKNVSFARTYALGALKLRNSLSQLDAPPSKMRAVMEAEISRTIRQFKTSCVYVLLQNYVAIGGDIRLAAAKIREEPIGDKLVRLELSQLFKFTNFILELSPESVATKFRISLTEAQTLGPALLTHVMFAQAFAQKNILIANVNLRDGLLKEMAEGRIWSRAIQEQIVRSAILTGRKFNFDEIHAVHVAALACRLFDELQTVHRLSERFRGILEIAALLHDIGSFISIQGRHKHSQYLIQYSDIFGIGKADLELIALIARYHRRALPQPTHDTFSNMSRERRVVVSKLASLLRIAKAMDSSNARRINQFDCQISPNWVTVLTSGVADVSIEALEVKNAGQLFEIIFGKRMELRAS